MNTVYLCWGTWFYPFLGAVGWGRRVLLQAGVCLAGRALQALAWRLDGVPSDQCTPGYALLADGASTLADDAVAREKMQ